MDAINNLANAATKAIWGENDSKDDATKPVAAQEPLSGVQGDTSKGEPFDAGNAQENSVPVKEDLSSKENPSAAHGSSKAPGDNTTDQIDTREPEDKHTSPTEAAKKNDVDNTEPMDQASIKGPGPKPLEQVAKEHGGDAGNVVDDKSSAPSDGAQTSAPNPATELPKDSHEQEGTGELLVKSSGLVADGGDFDAANPGAGREADRLLEEKGIHHESKPPANKVNSADATSASPTAGESSSPERKGVRGLGHKIKAKLRRSSNA